MAADMSIEELRADRDEKHRAWQDAAQRLREAEIAAAEFQVGDVVEVTTYGRQGRYKGWQRARVSKVLPRWEGHTDYRVNLQLKGGGWGKRDIFPKEIRTVQD